MPTYVYRREDGTTFEIQQRITEDALTVDPETGQAVSRVITGSAGLVFKGEGFYLTDYARKNSDGKKEGTSATKSEDTTKADTKSTDSASSTSASSDASSASSSSSTD
ncbi:MAG: zinc ribbon domain-containing protein [Bacteroidota bacterium]